MDNHQLRQYLEIVLGTRADVIIIPAAAINQVKVTAAVTVLVVHISPLNNENIGHFICVLIRSKKKQLVGEFFDSLGKGIDYYLPSFPYPIIFNWSQKIQNPESNLCGIYVLFFIHVRFNHYCSCILPTQPNRDLFKGTFSINTFKNDCKIMYFFKRLRSQTLPIHSNRSVGKLVSCVSNCV